MDTNLVNLKEQYGSSKPKKVFTNTINFLEFDDHEDDPLLFAKKEIRN